jgi:hypothetical protein
MYIIQYKMYKSIWYTWLGTGTRGEPVQNVHWGTYTKCTGTYTKCTGTYTECTGTYTERTADSGWLYMDMTSFCFTWVVQKCPYIFVWIPTQYVQSILPNMIETKSIQENTQTLNKSWPVFIISIFHYSMEFGMCVAIIKQDTDQHHSVFN